jgi:ribose 5-phosphate isomerase B
MRLAIGSDEKSPVAEGVARLLSEQGMDVELHGALKEGDATQWAGVALRLAERVSSGDCDQGVLFCWTSTGVSIAANKVSGIRAALCADAETARGARMYNDANVLCLSLRLTSEAVAQEILEAWLETNQVDEDERGSIDLLMHADRLRENDRPPEWEEVEKGRGTHAGQRA